MRILIASKRRPDKPGRRNGGVQTWIKTVAAELQRRGYQVLIADAEIGVDGYFDLGIFANLQHIAFLIERCKKTIMVSHGIVEAERPLFGRCDYTAYTSKEVRSHWGGSCGPIIRQPLDLEFWHDAGHERHGIVRYANRGGLEWLKYVGHIRNVSHEAAREALKRAECVIASGRAAVEAMACGAPVVVCDERHYQGALLDPDTFGAMQRNYSGRGGFEPTPNVLRAMIGAAIEYGSMRHHVEQHHDVRKVVEGLLC